MRPPRAAWPLLGVAAGVAAAAALTLLQDPTYRADASIVLVREGQPPGSDPELASAAAAAAELFESRAVAASALENLGLGESPNQLVDRMDVEAETASSLVRIEVDAPSREDARRTAQEVAEVSTVLFNDRFGPQTNASVWEPPSVEEISRGWARNLALGALVGALVGWVPFLVGRRRPPSRPKWRAASAGTVPGTVPGRDEPVTNALHERSGTVPGTVPAMAASEPATGPFVMPGFGEWTVADVERLLAEQGDAFPERRDELEIYLETLRSVAEADGRLPGNVDLVIEDVFGDLIARSGSTRGS